MKVAICLSGLIKKYNNNTFLNNLKSIPIEYDIFCHTWDYCDISLLDLPNVKIIYTEPNLNAFNNVSVDQFKKIDMNTTPENVLSMFYSMNQCIDLVEKFETEHNFKYDLVIRSRYDIQFNLLNKSPYDNRDIQTDLFNLGINDMDIIMPLTGFWVGKSMDLPIGIRRVADSFFVGDKSCRLLQKTYSYLNEINQVYSPYIHPEMLVAYSCEYFGLNIKLENFECNIVR